MAVDLVKGIMPVFVVKPGDPAKLLQFCGTGFLVKKNLLISCWHVLKETLQNEQRYAVAVSSSSQKSISYLFNVQQDLNGSDLATANLHCDDSVELSLSASGLDLGEHVWTYGYPFTDVERLPPGELFFQLNPRLMRGYMMRDFYYDHKDYGKVLSYELSIPAPLGLSGAPLVREGAFEIVGVIYGNNDVATVEELATVDKKTGDRTPQVERIVSFGLAHHLDTLKNLSGAATENRPLAEFLTTP